MPRKRSENVSMPVENAKTKIQKEKIIEMTGKNIEGPRDNYI